MSYYLGMHNVGQCRSRDVSALTATVRYCTEVVCVRCGLALFVSRPHFMYASVVKLSSPIISARRGPETCTAKLNPTGSWLQNLRLLLSHHIVQYFLIAGRILIKLGPVVGLSYPPLPPITWIALKPFLVAW